MYALIEREEAREIADKGTKKEGWFTRLNGGRGGREAGKCEVAGNTVSRIGLKTRRGVSDPGTQMRGRDVQLKEQLHLPSVPP